MENSLKDKVKNSDFVHKKLAKKIGVSPGFFSMCLRGDRIMSDDKQQLLRELLK